MFFISELKKAYLGKKYEKCHKIIFLGFILSPSGIFADVDTDGDGISDSIDQCPTQAKTINEFQDTDGCPDVAPVSESVPTSKSEQDNSFFQ